MRQFDVLRHVGRHRDSVPFVVVAQSALFDDYHRRVVIPFVRKAALRQTENPRLKPTFKIKGVAVVLHPLRIVSLADDQLGARAGSLAAEGDSIVGVLDELFTRAFGLPNPCKKSG